MLKAGKASLGSLKKARPFGSNLRRRHSSLARPRCTRPLKVTPYKLSLVFGQANLTRVPRHNLQRLIPRVGSSGRAGLYTGNGQLGHLREQNPPKYVSRMEKDAEERREEHKRRQCGGIDRKLLGQNNQTRRTPARDKTNADAETSLERRDSWMTLYFSASGFALVVWTLTGRMYLRPPDLRSSLNCAQ